MNLLLIIFVIVMVATIAAGYENGMVRQFITLVSMIISGTVIVLVVKGLQSYMDGQIINVVFMIILLCVVGIASHILSVVFAPVKFIAKLPVMKWLDKLLGLAFGVCEAVILFWIMYTCVMMLDWGMMEAQIMEYTSQSTLLSWLYQNNYLAYCIEQYLL